MLWNRVKFLASDGDRSTFPRTATLEPCNVMEYARFRFRCISAWLLIGRWCNIRGILNVNKLRFWRIVTKKFFQRNVRCSHSSSFYEESRSLGYDDVSVDNHSLTFRWTLLRPSSGSLFLDFVDPEQGCSSMLRNVGCSFQIGMASYPRLRECVLHVISLTMPFLTVYL